MISIFGVAIVIMIYLLKSHTKGVKQTMEVIAKGEKENEEENSVSQWSGGYIATPSSDTNYHKVGYLHQEDNNDYLELFGRQSISDVDKWDYFVKCDRL